MAATCASWRPADRRLPVGQKMIARFAGRSRISHRERRLTVHGPEGGATASLARRHDKAGGPHYARFVRHLLLNERHVAAEETAGPGPDLLPQRRQQIGAGVRN